MRHSWTALLALAAALFLVSGCAGFSRYSVGSDLKARSTKLEPSFRTFQPAEGEGPFPVVLLVHGCGGLDGPEGRGSVIPDYARIAADEGYVAIVVDSFTPRDISFDEAVFWVCKGYRLRGGQRAADVAAAATFARSLPNVDSSRIILAGWSHGAWAIMDLLSFDMSEKRLPGMKRRTPDALEGVAAAYLTYPYCGWPSRTAKHGWATPIAAEMVLAEDDDIAPKEKCLEAVEAAEASGADLNVEIFENVTHAFDESEHVAESVDRYNAEAAERAYRRFASFLRYRQSKAAE
ncbi:MAG: dienelactone hydrolase family protein [Pseudomonadota bacterium]